MDISIETTSEKGVTNLCASTQINASIDNVWNIMKFPGKVDAFHPLVKKSFMITSEQNGLGAKRHCSLLPMGEMKEIITEWKEKEAITLDVIGGKMLPPHHFMRGRFVLNERGNNTLITFTFSYQLKYGIMGRVMDSLLIRPQFKKAPPKYLEGLKNYIENS